MVTTFN